ncbi:beta-glucosidase family protein [Herbiconiux ginsengi]|uniref:Beta-glucosidase n=1 Tax=Herbiconiux ginsengi TaxID=381665 RepID=A0A1H3T621_9MICO|nr:glycoside hydrolase family 3 protein [Herbiconiux ginsengi]SDZ45510.1 beta-glucosidase [Herbiconiux ginsengi]
MSSQVLGGSTERQAPDAETLGDRVALLTGATSWTLHPLPSRDLRSLVLSDGPIGVRGVDEDTRPSAQLPSPSAWAATFDRDLVRRLGVLLGGEARRKGVDVVLAPVINLQRTPFGGRHFEALSEDPFLTGEIAGEVIHSVQQCGVAMCAKHYLGNESETERTTYLAGIPERALREVYLAPFERVVKDAQVWTVMAAYNGVDDGVLAAPATEHGSLVLGILKGEWGFDGVVMSDWLATTTTTASALGGLDLVMPGPDGPWGAALEEAVRNGLVDETVIDDKVERIVRLGRRVGAVGGAPVPFAPQDLPVQAETRALLREAVARATVVLGNDGLLPLVPAEVASIALIGPNAVDPFVQGGGSAFVTAPLLVSPEEGLHETFPEAGISLHRGTSGRRFPKPIDADFVSTPDGAPGYRLSLFDANGRLVDGPRVVKAGEGWNRGIPTDAVEALIQTRVHLGPGRHRLQVGVSGAHRIAIDDEVVSQSERIADHDVILDSSANHPAGPSVEIEVDDADGRDISIESRQQVVDAGAYGRFVRFVLRHELQHLTPDVEMDQAVAAARAAEVAVVIVGTNEETESEGWDRTTLALPGRQNELVERVLAANPRTVVVVNAGAPVILPWLDRARAVLWWWLPGQEAGGGLADALSGATEPSGRLPWTLPRDEADVPVTTTIPVDGRIDYTEGIHVGHREWDRRGLQPAREFGAGLGYGSWLYETLTVEGSLDDLRTRVAVTNVAARDARETVQIYLEAPGSPVDRPSRWLSGFATVQVPAGATREVDIAIRRRAFETWNTERHEWEIPDGRYVVHAAHSSRDLRLTRAITITDQSIAAPAEAPPALPANEYN